MGANRISMERSQRLGRLLGLDLSGGVDLDFVRRVSALGFNVEQ